MASATFDAIFTLLRSAIFWKIHVLLTYIFIQVVVPSLPGKALNRLLPFRNDDGIFDPGFIEERRAGLEVFVNKIAGHPLAQNERSLHQFLQETIIDKNYTPGKMRPS